MLMGEQQKQGTFGLVKLGEKYPLGRCRRQNKGPWVQDIELSDGEQGETEEAMEWETDSDHCFYSKWEWEKLLEVSRKERCYLISILFCCCPRTRRQNLLLSTCTNIRLAGPQTYGDCPESQICGTAYNLYVGSGSPNLGLYSWQALYPQSHFPAPSSSFIIFVFETKCMQLSQNQLVLNSETYLFYFSSAEIKSIGHHAWLALNIFKDRVECGQAFVKCSM